LKQLKVFTSMRAKLLILFLFVGALSACGDNSKNKNNRERSVTYDAPSYFSYGRAGDCESGHWISSVNRDGEVIILEDGSVWLVDPIDQIDSSLWLPISDIVACSDKLINVDDNETVGARRVR
jgi:hypothetical protein